MSGSRPKRRLGQHFLFDPRLLARIAEATLAGPGDTVLEIGPGPGGLTAALAARAGRVVAIEKDPDVLPGLKSRAPDAVILEADALDADWHAVAGHPDPARYIVAGNIPYNITSPLIDKALEPPLPARIVFLVQKEVAERIASGPGSADYGALSVGVQSAARVEKLFNIPAGAFKPPPKVDSAVIRLTPLDIPLVPEAARISFRRFVVALFGLRRKQLQRGLREVTGQPVEAVVALLGSMGIAPTARAETLTPAQIAELHRRVAEAGAGQR
ncbi:MAG TPA: 16S rRNA (adenine(1518)-N(6)/adenine(1519)-N(6))-dimethyltransferase RsmA [Gemmatimonadales bacterium]|nr:16S rRNA (adenine(1518)-N(6)/adenine(1519)-N(6))-dimethyltransferase RsmA [Gemmatimonadales bacterium]